MLLRDCGGKFQSSSLKMNENCAVHYFSLPATEHRQTSLSMKCIAMRHTERHGERERERAVPIQQFMSAAIRFLSLWSS
jgi:hypothetical protein